VQHAFALASLPSDDVVLTMIQDGDHRLSRPQESRESSAVAEIEQRRNARTPLHARTFCDAVEQRNGSAFRRVFTEDGIYHDVFLRRVCRAHQDRRDDRRLVLSNGH